MVGVEETEHAIEKHDVAATIDSVAAWNHLTDADLASGPLAHVQGGASRRHAHAQPGS